MKFDREKFKTVVLHIVWRTGDVRDFGLTKLNKVLWFSDARTFEAYGRSVTGETYIRRKFGPVPQHIDSILDELVREGLIQAWTEPFHDFEVKRFVAHTPPSTDMLTSEELSFVDWWIKHVAESHTAASISEKSHDYGWKIAEEGEVLPFKAFLAKRLRQPAEGDELDWARGAAKDIKSI